MPRQKIIWKFYKHQYTEIEITGTAYLLNIFIEEDIIMLEKGTKGIKINGKSIHCFWFVDDNALIVDSEENMMLLSLTNALQNKFKENQDIDNRK